MSDVETDEDVEEEEAEQRVLSVDLSPQEGGLGRPVTDALTRLRDGGWAATLATSVVAVSETSYAADSTKKPGQERPDHLRGEVKKAAHEVVHWWLSAHYSPLRVATLVHWVEGVTPKGGRSFGFQEALCDDPLGMPTELLVEYKPSARMFRQVKDEPQWAHLERGERLRAEGVGRDRAYNDGANYLNKRPILRSWREIDVWLSQWQAVIDDLRAKGKVA